MKKLLLILTLILVGGVSLAQEDTPTDSPTASPTNTETLTQTDSPTATPTNTETLTQTDSPTNTQTQSPTNTCTLSPTNTRTNTCTLSPTNTATNTITNTPVNTPRPSGGQGPYSVNFQKTPSVILADMWSRILPYKVNAAVTGYSAACTFLSVNNNYCIEAVPNTMVTAVTIILELGNRPTNYGPAVTITGTTEFIRGYAVDKPAMYMRCNAVSIAGDGGAVSINALAIK